jgi:hypothetical protein
MEFEELLARADEPDRDLLAAIHGVGRAGGMGLHTYPKGDAGNQSLYRACVRLEERGLLRRQIDQPDHIFFMPA